MIRYLIYLICTLSLAACASSPTASREPMADGRKRANSLDRKDVPVATDLTAYLQRIAGVSVNGSGASARIRVRGPVSFDPGSNDPLFVLNGSKLGHQYSTLYNSIDVRDIQRVRVLKGADETAIYGTQGAAGVIEVFLRD